MSSGKTLSKGRNGRTAGDPTPPGMRVTLNQDGRIKYHHDPICMRVKISESYLPRNVVRAEIPRKEEAIPPVEIDRNPELEQKETKSRRNKEEVTPLVRNLVSAKEVAAAAKAKEDEEIVPVPVPNQRSVSLQRLPLCPLTIPCVR
jgi:hypothetical protein